MRGKTDEGGWGSASEGFIPLGDGKEPGIYYKQNDRSGLDLQKVTLAACRERIRTRGKTKRDGRQRR